MPAFPPRKAIRNRLHYQGFSIKPREVAAPPARAEATLFKGNLQFLEVG